jgi:uncharacterized membrane protein YcaP (DUF421 family)
MLPEAVSHSVLAKQISSMTFWDLVSAIALGSLAANIITSQNEPLWQSAWVVFLWGAMAFTTGFLAMKSRKIRSIVQGVPTVVVANGQILEEALRKEHMNVDLLLAELRAAGVFTVRDVEFAIVEPDGKVSILKKTQTQPATPHDLHVPTAYKGLATAVVMEGTVLEENLRQMGLDRAWLERKLRQQGRTNLSEIFYAELDTDGTLYVDQQHDTAPPHWEQH